MEISSNYIKDIIQKNRDNIAFVIGNGIHYQYQDCDISWKALLKSLWLEYTGKQINIPNGISYTEFYDIIELNLYYNSNTNLHNSLKNKELRVKISDFKGIESYDLYKLIFELNRHQFDIKTVSKHHSELYRNKLVEFANLCRKWCYSNIDNATKLTDLDCIIQTIDALSSNTKKQIFIGSIKKNIANKFPSKTTYNLSNCIKTIKELNVPILTTNFDTYISESIGANKYLLSYQKDLYKFTDFYPWNMYYSTMELENPLDGFAVWHINGITKYHRSIRLGLSDYMGCVERARKMLQGQNLNEYFSGKNQVDWKGHNTWLHIIFNKSLFIFGLGLEENEVFLRWLLIQRAKYSKMFNIPLKGWYIGEVNEGKKFFLEQLGFEIIEIQESNYAPLYEALEAKY